MNYSHQYIRSAEMICGSYDGAVPLSAFLKQYFALHRKFGSKDRKRVAHICYCYYRLGHAVREMEFGERARLALFLCTDEPGAWQELFEPGWIGRWNRSLNERLQFVTEMYPSFSVQDIFPWQAELNTDRIDPYAFGLSHLVQPDLFLRTRPGYTDNVRRKLTAAGISFENISDNCIALPNGTKTEEVIAIDKEAVVQDHSSQRIAELLNEVHVEKSMQVWDCCAASGGKSILVQDTLSKAVLTVSDIRESIIVNLKKRFERAGIHPARVWVTDLTKPLPSSLPMFDLIICDAPCTGSGTWARTPEQICFFDPGKINAYAGLQRAIVSNIVSHIRPGGYLLYSTCSVFSKENEGIFGIMPGEMEVVEMKYLKGYDHKADSMFAVLFRKNDL